MRRRRSKPTKKSPGEQYADALARLELAEQRLRRQFRAWERAGSDVARLSRVLDRLIADEGEGS